MVRVTSEASASTSFQNAAAKSARPEVEPSTGNDRFAAMVDSNTASRNDRAPDPAPVPRRSDNTPPASDSRPRDNAAAPDRSDRTPRNDANARDASKIDADRNRSDNDVGTAGDSNVKGTTRRSKPESEKADGAEPGDTAQSSSEASSPAAGQTDVAQDGTVTTVANTLAALIPETTAPAVPVTPAADTQAPLAIAAAAIAATATIAAETAPAALTTVKTTANATAEEAGDTGTQAAGGQTVSDPNAMAEPALAGDAALAATATVANPVAAKSAAQLKHADTARKSETTIVEPADPTGTVDTTTQATTGTDTAAPAATPSHEAVAKPKAETGATDAIKGDASGYSASQPAHANPGAHPAAADPGHIATNTLPNGLPVPGALPHATPTTAPAAASQLTATAAANGAVPVSGLAMEIAASVKSGKTSFEIRLDPAELGRIDVRIDIDRHGQVTSHLTVERAETLSMLRQDANQLQRALDNAGLQTGNSGLQFSLRDQSSQGQQHDNQSNPNAHRLVVHEEESVPAVVAGRGYGRMLGASGGVDIRI